MTADLLLDFYERIAEAPDAIARLRRFVLDLAVRGKLVPQDTADEPASELLRRIVGERARLVNSGAVKASPPLPAAGDLPFQLPSAWEKASLSDLAVCPDYRRQPINSAGYQRN